MNFLLYTFSVTLITFSLIKTEVRLELISCYNVTYDHDNAKCKSLKGREFVNCWQEHRTENLENCVDQDSECLTWTLTLKDATEFVYKACDKSQKMCETFKQTVEVELKEQVKDSKCEFCKTKFCNFRNNPEGVECDIMTYDVTPCEQYHDERKLLECLKKQKTEKKQKCNYKNSECLSFVSKLKDKSEIVWKLCDTDRMLCGSLKKLHREQYFKRSFESAHCYYCTSDLCNEIKPPDDKDVSLKCHLGMYDRLSCNNYDNKNPEILHCWKKHKTEEVETCTSKTSECMTYTLKLKDKSKIAWRSCASSRKICEKLKESIEKPFKGLVELSQCEFCTTKMCNIEITNTSIYATHSKYAIGILIFVLLIHLL